MMGEDRWQGNEGGGTKVKQTIGTKEGIHSRLFGITFSVERRAHEGKCDRGMISNSDYTVFTNSSILASLVSEDRRLRPR